MIFIPLRNKLDTVGAGMVGWLESRKWTEKTFCHGQRQIWTRWWGILALLPKKIKKVAVCGGSGSFFIKDAIAAGADAFVTADFKYHEFFDADGKTDDCRYRTLWEWTIYIWFVDRYYSRKFPNFAIRLTEHNTNPINYFI